jgi:surface protein
MSTDDEEVEDQNEEESPLFGSERGTFSPSKRLFGAGSTDENTQSFVTQAALVGVIAILIITLSTISLISFSSTSTVTVVGDYKSSSLLAPKRNLLGLYHARIPSSGTAMVSVSSSSSQQQQQKQQQQQQQRLEEEAFFLRYLIMPLEASEGDVETKQDGNSTSMISTTSQTRLMRPRARLLQTVKALQKELEVTAKEDFLAPMVQKWTGRLDAIKRRFQLSDQPDNDSSSTHDVAEPTSRALMPPTTSTTSKSSTKQGVLSPRSILGIYPNYLDAPNPNNDAGPVIGDRKNLLKTFVPGHVTFQTSSTRSNKGKTSVCPTNMLCYYTIPPTIAKKDAVCDIYCRRCFETTTELKDAIQEYIKDPSNHTSRVATTYGWPIRNWCTSLITNFDSLFANTPFNQDISTWDLSSATSMRSMFQNATAFNQPLAHWDVSQVQDMRYLFAGASSFHQNLLSWNVARVRTMNHILDGTTLMDKHHRDLFVAWSQPSNRTEGERGDHNKTTRLPKKRLQIFGVPNISFAWERTKTLVRLGPKEP